MTRRESEPTRTLLSPHTPCDLIACCNEVARPALKHLSTIDDLHPVQMSPAGTRTAAHGGGGGICIRLDLQLHIKFSLNVFTEFSDNKNAFQ